MNTDYSVQKGKTNFQNPYAPIIPVSWQGKTIISALLLLFFIITSYKLTHASLWFDEGVEYLISTMPFTRMISAVKGTFQPPLYNFLMHFLLKISINEYWFRLTSVLFGLLGCLGLYAAVNEASGWKTAGITMFFYTFLRNSVYYNQECAEYALLICSLFWTIYFFICLLNQFSYKKAIGFTICCILSMYSQYGAIFSLAGLSISILLFNLMKRQWLNIKILLTLMGSATIAFGIPLYLGFIKFQSKIHYMPQIKPFINIYEEQKEFFGSIDRNFSFLFTSYYKSQFLITTVDIFYIFAVCVIIWSTIQRINNRLKYIGTSVIITYLLYYLMVRFNIYAYGNAGSRYALPMLPIILICLSLSFNLLFQKIYNYIRIKNIKLAYFSIILGLALILLHNYSNWLTIQKNWSKEDVRSTINLWLSETNGTDEMYLYYAAVQAFSFYAENLSLDYGKEIIDIWGFNGADVDPGITQYKNFHYGEWMRGKNTEYVKSSIQQSFSNNMPDHLWFMLSHINLDNQKYMEAFSELGYGYQVYRWDDARLLRLYNHDYLTNNYSVVSDSDKNLSKYISSVDEISQSLNANNSIALRIEGNDPKIFFTLPQDSNYDNTKTHKVLIDFTSEYTGNLQLFYQDDENVEFIAKNVVNSHYMVGHNRVFVELPEHAKLEILRLDIDNMRVPKNSENKIILSKFIIFEGL